MGRWFDSHSVRVMLYSTFKLLAAALVLAQVDRGKKHLDRRVVFSETQLFTYSLVTREHIGGEGMTVEALCELGGPPGSPLMSARSETRKPGWIAARPR
jgi:hypothetical protein